MPNQRDSSGAPAGRGVEPPPRAPRWVKVAAIVGAIVALLVVMLLLLGGGNHGPGRHLGGDTGTSSAEQSERQGAEHTPPAGGH